MRRTRPLLLLLIAGILGVVGVTYVVQRSTQAREAPPKPPVLPESVSARADKWTYTIYDGRRRVIDVIADKFEADEAGSLFKLQGVELHIFHDDGKSFDQVKSAKAEFDVGAGALYSEGNVEITMNVPGGDTAKPGHLVVIRSSGVRFESKTGKASTQQFAHFTFDRGRGHSRGAQYDPMTRQLEMFNDVRLEWQGENPGDKPMEIEAGNLVYQEREAKILLTPWSRFRRDTLSLEAAGSVVTLEEGSIKLVEAVNARGVNKQPAREVEYAADQLHLRFAENNVIQSITGDKNASLISRMEAGHTTITAGRLDLEFEIQDGDSLLKKANANGNSVVESKPIPRANVPLADTRIMRADSIALEMRPGGEEIQKVETHSPGEIEFVPNRPGQKRRHMTAERMSIAYGTKNQVEAFRAFNVSTRTQADPQKGKPAPAPALTFSKEMAAQFDPASGEMVKLEQWDNFRYEEAERRATASRATMENPTERMTLTGAARVWDPSGSTSADTIVMHQKTSDFEATGNVASTRLPEKKKEGEGLLSGDEPVQAKAARMTATGNHSLIRYETDALLWQGANRIEASRIDIDRAAGRLEARGNVVTQFVDEPKKAEPKKDEPKKVEPKKQSAASSRKAAPVFTTVTSPEMDYSDRERVAHYRGGAVLKRPGMTVHAQEIRAFLQKAGAGSSLDKAFADGSVRIVQVTPERSRTGTAGHAEYYAQEGRVVLQQGEPQLEDSVRGTTRGKQLTWFSNDDRLLVEGAENQPVKSRILRR